MSAQSRPIPTTLQTADAVSEALHDCFVDWQVQPASSTEPIANTVQPRSIGDIRMIEISGSPFRGARGRSEIAEDGQEFLGVLFQRSGKTHCRMGNTKTLVSGGDVALWYSDRPVKFEMPDEFRKLCMLIPVSRFETTLANPTSYEGLHLTAGSPLAALLGSYLTTLSENVASENTGDVLATVDVTIELLASVFRANKSKIDQTPRKKLQARVFQYVESRLGDPDLTPAMIAEAHGISVRSLYLLFNEQGVTVSGWIRQRRLARCKSELANMRGNKSVTQIAYQWGFSDSAHFSRLFKFAYGQSPTQFKANLQNV